MTGKVGANHTKTRGLGSGDCDLFDSLLADMTTSDRAWELGTLGIYLGGLLWIGLRSAREIHTVDDYTVAGRGMPWIVVLATTAATMVGGGASVGYVGKCYAIGIAAAVVTCAWHLQLIFTGLFLAPRLRGLGLVTVAQYVDRHFGELARRIAVVSGGLFLVGALVAQMAAIGTVTEMVLGIPGHWAVLLGGSVVVLYSTVGGIRAVVKTDVMQFVVLVAGIGGASAWLVWKHGGWGGLVAHPDVGLENFNLTSTWKPVRLATLFGAFLLGEMMVPPYAVRCFIAKDEKHARRGVAGGGVFLLLFLPVATLTLGMASRAEPAVKEVVEAEYLKIRESNAETREVELERIADSELRRTTAEGHETADRSRAAQVAFPALMRTTFPPWMAGVMIAAIIAAVMSSADSCLSCLATSVMEDIYRVHIDPSAGDARLLQVARWTTLLAGVVSAVCALVWSNIADILEFIYDFWAPSMVLPFLVGAFCYRRSQSPAVVFAMIGGPLATAIWRFGLESPFDVSPGFFGFGVSVLVYLLLRPLCRRIPENHWLRAGVIEEGAK